MYCDVFNTCPFLYECIQKACVHDPLLTLSYNLLTSALLIPILTALNNKVGFSSIWIYYLVFVSIMFYLPQQIWNLISAVALGGSISGLIFKYIETRQEKQSPSFHFYYINVCTAPLVVGVSIGIRIVKVEPFILSMGAGVIAVVLFIILFVSLFKEIRSDQKIAVGVFKKLLPSRYLSPRKSKKLSMQMSSIEQVESQEDAKSFQMRNTERIKLRQQLLNETQSKSYWKHAVILILTFIAFESLCLSINQILVFFGLENDLLIVFISFVVVLTLMVLGNLCLYKFYIQQKMMQERLLAVKLGLDMDGQKMIKLVSMSLVAGILQGIFGIGYCELILIFMTTSRLTLADSIVSTSVLSLLVALTYSLNTLFCGYFHTGEYFGVLGYTLVSSALFQFLFDRWFSRQVDSRSIRSSLVILIICIEVSAAVSMLSSLGFIHFRFGSQSYLQFGSLTLC